MIPYGMCFKQIARDQHRSGFANVLFGKNWFQIQKLGNHNPFGISMAVSLFPIETCLFTSEVKFDLVICLQERFIHSHPLSLTGQEGL